MTHSNNVIMILINLAMTHNLNVIIHLNAI